MFPGSEPDLLHERGRLAGVSQCVYCLCIASHLFYNYQCPTEEMLPAREPEPLAAGDV